MTDYKPGTVAVATYCGEPNVRVSRYADRMVSGWVRLTDPDDFVNDTEDLGEHRVTDIRPLVVLDLGINGPTFLAANLKQAAERHRSKGFAATADDLIGLADQIEAQTRPPKPAEPTGLGAVVEDAEGRRWVFTGDRDAVGSWWLCADDPSRWPDIAAVRVLSEGVAR